MRKVILLTTLLFAGSNLFGASSATGDDASIGLENAFTYAMLEPDVRYRELRTENNVLHKVPIEPNIFTRIFSPLYKERKPRLKRSRLWFLSNLNKRVEMTVEGHPKKMKYKKERRRQSPYPFFTFDNDDPNKRIAVRGVHKRMKFVVIQEKVKRLVYPYPFITSYNESSQTWREIHEWLISEGYQCTSETKISFNLINWMPIKKLKPDIPLSNVVILSSPSNVILELGNKIFGGCTDVVLGLGKKIFGGSTDVTWTCEDIDGDEACFDGENDLGQRCTPSKTTTGGKSDDNLALSDKQRNRNARRKRSKERRIEKRKNSPHCICQNTREQVENWCKKCGKQLPSLPLLSLSGFPPCSLQNPSPHAKKNRNRRPFPKLYGSQRENETDNIPARRAGANDIGKKDRQGVDEAVQVLHKILRENNSYTQLFEAMEKLANNPDHNYYLGEQNYKKIWKLLTSKKAQLKFQKDTQEKNIRNRDRKRERRRHLKVHRTIQVEQREKENRARERFAELVKNIGERKFSAQVDDKVVTKDFHKTGLDDVRRYLINHEDLLQSGVCIIVGFGFGNIEGDPKLARGVMKMIEEEKEFKQFRLYKVSVDGKLLGRFIVKTRR